MYTGLFELHDPLCVRAGGLVATAEAPDISRRNGARRHYLALPRAGFGFRPTGRGTNPPAVAAEHAGKPNIRRDAQHQLVAEFYSVNGLVRATLLEGEGQLRVETRRNSIWRFFDNAHALTIQESASDWRRAPGWYIELSIGLDAHGAHGCLAGPDDSLAILVDEGVARGGHPGIRHFSIGCRNDLQISPTYAPDPWPAVVLGRHDVCRERGPNGTQNSHRAGS